MSSSSETSLAELPQPYDISSAVSRALQMDRNSDDVASSHPMQRRGRSFSYPTAGGYYDFPAHSAAAYNASESENYAAAATYYHQTSSPYYYAAIPGSAPPEGGQFLFPHPYSSIHPAEQQVQMEIEAWSENTAMSICSGGSGDLLESQVNMEQLDQFCKYIDSSGDEEFIGEKGESSMLGSGENDYAEYNMRCRSPPPKKKRKNLPSCSMPLKSYYEDDPENMEDLREWEMELENASMWREFDSIGTEMVITKAGRRMFPTISVKTCGLDPKETYAVKLDILPADSRRYKYLQSEWVAVGRSDKKTIYCEYEHPDSPNSGSYWMDKTIAFKMVKLTNNKSTTSPDQIILNSMHKYLPCIKIICQKDGYTQHFRFPETSFIAVTAYQSTGVTQLKINNNPYARAFRESVPSNGSQKSGGHYRHSSNRTNSLSPSRGASSRQTTPSSSPRHHFHSKQKTSCHSTVSVESGFESDTAADKRRDSASYNMPQNSSFQSSSLVTYWGDDNNSLWNPNIITPDPIMDNNGQSSFTTTYLKDSAVEAEYEITDSADDSGNTESLMGIPEGTMANVEAAIPVDDDVFF